MSDKNKVYEGAYRLHTKAVEELAGATAENTPRYSKEELENTAPAIAGSIFPTL